VCTAGRSVKRAALSRSMGPMRAAPRLLVLVLLLGAAPLAALAKGGKEVAKPPEWTEEEGHTVLRVFSPPLKAYFAAPSTLPEGGKKAELIVILHGHGGTATGMLGYAQPLADARGAYLIACEGSETLQTDKGPGHTWKDPDVQGILACVDATIAKHPIDPKRILLEGHSMGGTMSLRTYAARPAQFVGVFTTASPEIPSGAQKGARVAVCLGTKDPNFSQFPGAVAACEKTVVGRVIAVTDVPHDLPNADYARECIAYVLDSKAPSDVLRLPFDPTKLVDPPPDTPAAKAKGKGFRHALIFATGGRGAPADAVARADAKKKAAELSASLKKLAGVGVADAIAAATQDPLSKESKGEISGDVLARYGGGLVIAISKLKGGEVSAPVESDAGWHVVVRDAD
jgi:poly(3-hydroxybutyrate) depolymerase